MKTAKIRLATDTPILIEKGVPMPSGGRTRYPFSAMEVGDSFAVKDGGTTLKNGETVVRNRVSSAAGVYSRRHPGMKFAIRKIDGMVRCWRIA